MKMNIECIRDVMLWLEENISMESVDGRPITTSINWAVIYNSEELLNKYEQADIQYAILNLLDGGMVHADKNSRFPDGTFKMLSIDDITWQGHEFLNSIRSEPVWKSVMKTAKKMNIVTVKALMSLCGAAIQGLVQDPAVIKAVLENIQ